MFKSNNQKLNIAITAFTGLAIFAIGMTNMTSEANAQAQYNTGFQHRTTLVYGNNIPVTNPQPSITSISPDSSNRGVGTKTITITGSGFFPGSIAKINAASRPTTFIDSEHLLIKLNDGDLVNAGTFYITVFNKAPEGGYSNAATLTVKGGSSVSTGDSENENSENYNASLEQDTFQEINDSGDSLNGNESVSSLASNTIFGSNSFMPSGIIQWVLLAIIIMIIVIIVRKIFGGEDRYHSTPLKHA